MLAVGIILGITTALLKGIDTMMNKSLMGTTSAIDHSLYRIIFVIPYLGIAALINWNLQKECIVPLIAYGVIEAVNILFHQYAIKSLNPVHAEMLSKSKSLLAYILSLVLLIESVSISGVCGIILFLAGMLLTIDYKSLNPKEFTDWKGYLFEIISVLARTIKPFILRDVLIKNIISNETLAFLSMIVAFVVIFIVFRPKMSFKQIHVGKYFLQASVVGASMITSGYAVLYAGAVLSSMLENCSVFFIMLIMLIMYKKKEGAKIWIGALLTILGTWINTM